MDIYIRLLRADQYIKNTLVFLPLFFSGSITNVQLLFPTSVVFVLFCLVSSSVYILNDLTDKTADRKHPEKKERPLAAGLMHDRTAKIWRNILLIIAITGSLFISLNVSLVLISYFLINVAYNLGLKHIPIVDLMVVAAGFILRIIAGGFAAGVYLSPWILLMTVLLAFFIGLSKRRDDAVIFEKTSVLPRKVSRFYFLKRLDRAIVLNGLIIIITYIWWSLSDEVINRMETEFLVFTSPVVLLGIGRYLQITFRDQVSGDPVKLLAKDTYLQFYIVLWLAIIITLLYF